MTKKTRPWAKPHFGSTCERLVGTTNTQFVHNLIGNTQIMTNVRQVTKAVNPKTQACWTYAALFAGLCHWAYEVYDTTPHAALGQSPRDAFLAGEKHSGARAHTWIRDDDAFRLWTLPSTRTGTALVQPGQGVKINYLSYWCEEFRDPQVVRTRVEVRYVPWDASQAYAFVHHRWVPCVSCYRARIEGRSTQELLLMAEELRQRDRLQARTAPLTAKRLAEHLTSLEEQEVLLLQRRRDAEMRSTLALIQSGRGEDVRCRTPRAGEQAVFPPAPAESQGMPGAAIAPVDEEPRPTAFRRFL